MTLFRSTLSTFLAQRATCRLPTPSRPAPSRPTPSAWAAAIALLAVNGAALAAKIDTGIADLTVNWDNTLKYSNAFRLKSQNPLLISSPNLDDGDRNFNKGLISNRLSLLSEFDVQYQQVGARFSGSGWYDDVYNRHNDNPGVAGGAFPNQTSVPYNEFTRNTRDLQGRRVELLDAFVFGRFDVFGDRAIVRLGNHGLVWGESLFFGNNAIAGGQSPVDALKLISVPGTPFKEAIRPVPQVSGQIQLTPSVTVAAYYQYKFIPNRIPSVGSYFSPFDTNVDGAENLRVGPLLAPRQPDLKAKDSGQGGLQLRWRVLDTDLGFYAIRFHSKSHEQVIDLGMTRIGVAPIGYYVTYQEGTQAYAVSASRSFGAVNLAAEASIRNNEGLASTSAVDPRALAPAMFRPAAYDNSGNPAYAVGRSAHVNVSALWALDPNVLFNEGNVAIEAAWNRVLSCQRQCNTIDANSTRDAITMRAQMEPTYRQVISGWDVGVPVGLGFTPKGSRSRALGAANTSENGGDMTVGLNGTYLDTWRLTLAYTHYYGATRPFLDSKTAFAYGQYFKDRDFVAFSIRRTF